MTAPAGLIPLPFFVYGTLRPGAYNHDRLLLGRTAAEEEARLPGALLYDGPGYPYAVPGAGTVAGTLVTAAPEAYGELLGALDRMEGDAGYERAAVEAVRLRDGGSVRAWTYLAAPETALGPLIPTGDWFRTGPRRPAPGVPRTP
ncbi:gamma-glutamylcyclotransferase family protein [Streptomyces gardneri]|uniref:Gamma-glutamylcyclotransferase n=1 Tax=Streptomyces gardneri TaxID=66892 RepID=A0A4Y3RLJ8_9ACTN|nr:gamma-glutamylcyclotransferase family protein [Streptomyces gardneri]GEB58616.1 gamma-glutamylcyclotransferase [Streptomyces gardneri]GHG82884.1 gamma-glutamylcyclotransferase [Streptomyces gardneri]